MTNYEPDTPRAALAVGAMFFAGITFAALVVAPASLDARNDAPMLLAAAMNRHDAPPLPALGSVRDDVPALLAAANGNATLPIEADLMPARIDVAGARESVIAQAVEQGGASETGTGMSLFHAPNIAWALPNGSGPCRPHG